MTRLRKMMLDELERRNYTQTTRRAYLLAVEQFAKHLGVRLLEDAPVSGLRNVPSLVCRAG
jgi:hypothetical protein